MSEKITYVRKSGEERKCDIERALVVRQVVELKPRASRTAIARAIGMAVSPLLTNYLWEMVDEGRLIADPQAYRGGVAEVRWLYQVPADRLPALLGDAYEVRS